MKKVITGALVVLALSACSQTEKGAGIGAASGAIIGGLASGSWEGAAIGAAAGGAGGALIGNARDRQARERDECRYRDRYGRVYFARCS